MTTETFLFTSESVGKGHPDKICDRISDSILDSYLKEDSESKTAIETMISPGLVVICGEIKSKAKIDIEKVVRNIVGDEYQIIININEQSGDIYNAVKDGGAGDQGVMFGYATNETEERIPIGLLLSHRLVMEIEKRYWNNSKIKEDFMQENHNKNHNKLTKIDNENQHNIILGPDCKSQVTIEYLNNNGELIPLRVDNVVMSVQHDKNVDRKNVQNILKKIVEDVIPENLLKNTKFYLQPTDFTIGGPMADTGLTGRKIIVDTYGGFGCHGGGAFSGKDPSKVDRSGAYVARWIAKSLVDSKIVKRVQIQISYAIGVTHPLSINIETYGTSKMKNTEIIELIKKNFDLSPNGIIRDLKLKNPIYENTAVYGHFGRNIFSWEKSKNLK